MSDGVNQVFLVGQLGANPELRYAGDQPVCEFRVATTESWKNGSGERQEHTEWHRVVVWGPSAEACNKVLSKGWSVTVLGNIRTETYEKDGEKKYATKIRANRVIFGSAPGGGSDRGAERSADRGEDRRDDRRGDNRQSAPRDNRGSNDRRPDDRRGGGGYVSGGGGAPSTGQRPRL
jgi:single-strand DNA-binding protein